MNPTNEQELDANLELGDKVKRKYSNYHWEYYDG